VGSALLLIGILLSVYYKNEVQSLEASCTMELKNASMQIKNDILNAHMHHKNFVPKKLEKNNINYAIFDKDKSPIYSYLQEEKLVEFNEDFYGKDKYHFYMESLNEKDIPIKYIVTQTTQGVQSKENLKIYIIIAFFLSAVFVGFIAFFLARILLKPVREKVVQLDNFIKDSAHELNTPIAVLMTSTSALKQGRNTEKMLKYIISSAKQISQLYNDMHYSAFSEQDVFLDVSIDFAELITESVEFFQDIAITKGIKINLELEKCDIFMDKTKTQKIVNNLISNAIKYSNKDTQITVKLKGTIFSVQDFGIGIDQKDQEEIFKRYKRGENFEGGFGIGLDIVNGVCKEYELKVSLKSKKNEGSTFFIDFKSVAK
jgi:two-component system OmpR family sensor kinase